MIPNIKKLRVGIDGLYQLTKELKPLGTRIHNYEDNTFEIVEASSNSNEIEQAATSLILAKAWLGKLLAEFESTTPYSSGKKSIVDIEPTADVATAIAGMREPFTKKGNTGFIDTWELNGVPMAEYDNKNHIEKVDWLREEVQYMVDRLKRMGIDTVNVYNREASIARTNTYNYLCEAKMWFGFEFARLYKEADI